jgi:PAS domain S-box-containing protein
VIAEMKEKIRLLERERDAALEQARKALETDISRCRLAEQALRESEERFRGTFENAAEGIAHIGFDNRFLRVNQRLCTITGYSREELMAKTFSEITHPEDRAGDFPMVERLRRGEIDFFTREKRYLRKDDSIIWVQVTASLQRSETGAPLYYISLVEDISSRKKAEQALRDSEERLELAMGSVAGGFWHLEMDPDHPSHVPDLLYLSPQLKATIGYADEEFPDSLAAWRDRMHPADLRVAEETARKYLQGQFPIYETEYRIRHRDGSWRWIFCRGRLLRDGRDRPLRWAGIDFDITPHKLHEEQLRRAKDKAEAANRAKSEILDNMSHEIRTPVTVTVGAIEIVQEMGLTPPQRRLLGMAVQSAHRLLELIDDLLDMSRIEADRMELHDRAFDLRSCVQQVTVRFAEQARDKGLRLEVEIAPDVPSEIIGDPDRLEQVLVNLIGNAVKFTRRGRINVIVGTDNRFLHFAVRDTGIGIPRDKQDRLFRSFSQVDSSLTRRYGGTGLGLAISRGLVELMGGEIGVESTEGKGSVFSFTVPVQPAVDCAPFPTERLPHSKAVKPGRVLLAEDGHAPALRLPPSCCSLKSR